jgi:tRNA-specific 2-thiouridylase
MGKNQKKVVVAMSGGVDSSVTAGLLLEQGYEVAGVSLRLWETQHEDPKNCSDYRSAKTVADVLGIPHTLLDLRLEFLEAVAKPFAQSYLQGRTPNPCVACNRNFKLGTLVKWAKEQGADYVATGHYARIDVSPLTGRASLSRGVHREKDQSYFLFALSQEQLAHTLFPVGPLHKDEVRHRASRFGLPVADRPESQDVCFGNYQALVESFADDGDLSHGEIVDQSGKVLGHHRGIHRLTVGQRKGLGLSAPHPLYVLKIDGGQKRVVVGKKEELGSEGFVAHSVNWIEPPEEDEILAHVQLRYRSPSVPCLLRANREGGGDRVLVQFSGSPCAITPGQAAVFYEGERVLGGGWILEGISSDEGRTGNTRM